MKISRKKIIFKKTSIGCLTNRLDEIEARTSGLKNMFAKLSHSYFYKEKERMSEQHI
jgi:hypothetical protein